MDEQTIRLLQESFAEVMTMRQEAAALFYERLFALDPALRPLFADADMRSQEMKLMAALALVVGKLREIDSVVPVLETLAVKHVAYGVEERHYATVGKALIQTLSLAFGPRFTPELRNAWLSAYGAISAVMIAAARRGEATLDAAE
ncbi:MAG: hemin receptor [Rhizobiaceae bacterium]|nr:hemin receptor [Rhizobiaceae bacterium]